MIKIVKKLLLGNPLINSPSKKVSTLEKRVLNIKNIWNNSQHNDVGIEKILRLFLALSQFVFIGTYIKHFFGRKGREYQDLFVDFYVIIKTLYPLIIIKTNMMNNPFFFFVAIWLMCETLLYVPTLVFASDISNKPDREKRILRRVKCI